MSEPIDLHMNTWRPTHPTDPCDGQHQALHGGADG